MVRVIIKAMKIAWNARYVDGGIVSKSGSDSSMVPT